MVDSAHAPSRAHPGEDGPVLPLPLIPIFQSLPFLAGLVGTGPVYTNPLQGEPGGRTPWFLLDLCSKWVGVSGSPSPLSGPQFTIK